MPIGPDAHETVARARSDLRIGLPVALRMPPPVAGAGRLAESGPEHWLVLAAETVTAARLADLTATGRAVLAITARRAETLKARIYDGDIARLAIPKQASPRWIASIIDPTHDLDTPLKGPFTSVRDGAASLPRAALRLTKTARLLPAVVVVPWAGPLPEGLTVLDTVALDAVLDGADLDFSEISAARVPTRFADAGRVRVFRPSDGGDEHYAVEIGRPDPSAPVLVRLHSACFTGDILASLKCDCGPQLQSALALMAEAGAGILLYLNQEGRGIGLANKLRAYALQDQGFDTVEANHRLGFEDDERDFRIGAAILRRMGVDRVRLLTNNPAKVAMLDSCGIAVEDRVPLLAARTPQNDAYLSTKAQKSGHIL